MIAADQTFEVGELVLFTVLGVVREKRDALSPAVVVDVRPDGYTVRVGREELFAAPSQLIKLDD